MMIIKYLSLTTLLLTISLIITGCAATTVNIYRASGDKTLCNEHSNSLGTLAILPETAWRENQKEPNKRKQMAVEEVKAAFQKIPCGSLSAPGGIREFSDWSNIPETELIQTFSTQGVDTIILFRIEELTPRLVFTFSLPFLWSGSNEVDFRIRALSVKSKQVLVDMRLQRIRGGPFNIRPAEWSRTELKAALNSIIK